MGVKLHRILSAMKKQNIPDYAIYTRSGISKHDWMRVCQGKPVHIVVLAQIGKFLNLSLDEMFVLTEEDEQAQREKHAKFAEKAKKLHGPGMPTHCIKIKDHTGREFASMKAMAEFYGISKDTLRHRLKVGWKLEKALLKPTWASVRAVNV
jgi:hypothetical protein